MRINLDSDFEHQNRFWYVVNSVEILENNLLQVQNRFVFDRHMNNFVYAYPEEHSALHLNDFDEQFDLLSSRSVSQGVFIVGVTDSGLNLYFARVCDLNEDPSQNCSATEPTFFVDFKAWLLGEEYLRLCTGTYADEMTAVYQRKSCANRDVLGIRGVSDTIVVPLVENKVCAASKYSHTNGFCASCVLNCAFCESRQECQ